MPRFENERPDLYKNMGVDRTVPENENYYGRTSPIDYGGEEPVVTDNQRGFNPCTDFDDEDFITRQPERRSPEQIRPPERRVQSAPQRRTPPKRKKKKPVGKIILALILVLVLVLGGTGLVSLARINHNDKLENPYVNAADLKSDSGVKNILLLGVDARPDDETEASRSDTMMLVSVDKNHHSVKMVSFLRDTWVYVPTLNSNQRLNAACSSAGYQGVVDAIEYNFGVKIDGYAVVDFDMFKVLVDSIGGVKVNVTQEEADEVTNHPKRYGNVTLESGEYKLTGEQALAYCRIRKIDTDWKRTERQRTVMQAILSGAKRNPLALLNIAVKAAPYVETNLSTSELVSLGTAAATCLGNMYQTKVPFEGTWEYANKNGASVIAINTDANRDKLIDYIYNLTNEEIEALEEQDGE